MKVTDPCSESNQSETDWRTGKIVPSPTLEGIKGALRHLCEVNNKIVEFLQSEYKRKMTLQNYIGEAVIYELLCQSYGVPEYTTEESYKRLLSVILGAMKNHQNRPVCSLDAVDNLDGLWNCPDDPHSLETVTPDIDMIRLRKIVSDTLAKEAPEKSKPSPDLTQLWEQPTGDMNTFNKVFNKSATKPNPSPNNPDGYCYNVQVNGKSVGNFRSGLQSADKSLQQNALNIAVPIIKKRRRKVKKVIQSGTTWNFVV